MSRIAPILLCCVLAVGLGPAVALGGPPEGPRTILDLQPSRRSTAADWADAGGRRGSATLVEINPNVNAWLVLTLDWPGALEPQSYHLENPDPAGTRISLEQGTSHGLRINSGTRSAACVLWSDHDAAPLEEARQSGLPYAPLCEGKLYLRNQVRGTYTHLEKVTDFLRDRVWGGDHIVTFVKDEFFRDAFVEKSGPTSTTHVAGERSSADEPLAAALDPGAVGRTILPEHLGLDLSGAQHELPIGVWHTVNNASGIYLSAICPQALAPSILSGFHGKVATLDAVEGGAVDYLVAFDLAQFDLGYELGTDHPRLDWSGRELPDMRDARLPGPDGIGTSAPLARTGMVSPELVAQTAATFAGGFKREHAAFHYGELARHNHGSPYGFMEQGAVFSTLLPGLSTVYVLDDGSIGMKTWAPNDEALVPHIRHARQNGVPLIEEASARAAGVPGPLVAQWGAGNWSGSEEQKLRTVRAGLCMQFTPTHRFLIFGYFSTATPSAMARVFQAYGCQYAMHLDMNALEHTYMALYTRKDGRLLVQHLIEGMGEVDRKGGSQIAPRFLGFPDDRDFFYLIRRPTTAHP
jgi:hypothetical protein